MGLALIEVVNGGFVTCQICARESLLWHNFLLTVTQAPVVWNHASRVVIAHRTVGYHASPL